MRIYVVSRNSDIACDQYELGKPKDGDAFGDLETSRAG